jgi:3-oxoacid CoA-transferase A subunit
VDLIVTDIAVIRVTQGDLVLEEVASGWNADDVAALTEAPLEFSPNLKEVTFEASVGEPPTKLYATGQQAVQDLPGGATVNVDGFAGPGGMAHYLLLALRDHGAKDLTIISNTAGIARIVNFGTPPGRLAIDHSILVDNNQVKKVIASYPVSPRASVPNSFELAYQRGEVELEVVPQGTLAERLRAGGAGVAAFYTPTAVGTLLAEGKETRTINGKEYVLETGLVADYCLIRAHKADTLGNLVYKGTSRNFNAVMAPAARVTVVEVDEIVEPGGLGPEDIVTPGVYIDRIVKRPPGFSAYE